MKNDVNMWIKQNRMLRLSDNSQFFIKKRNKILKAYEIALGNRKIPAQPYVYESHQADIRQIPQLNAIICDIHYYDIARLVTTSFYITPTYDIIRLSDALIADSMICHGMILSARHFAEKFIRGPYASAFCTDQSKIQQIDLSVQFQTIYTIMHEIEHFECARFSKEVASLIEEQIELIVDQHNLISQYINSINLNPILQFLDNIKLESDLKRSKMSNTLQQVLFIVSNYGKRILMPGLSFDEKNKLLIFACDNYLRGVKAGIINKKEMITEGTCDLLALLHLLDCRGAGMSKAACRKVALEAYMLSLLTSDLIWGAMNIFKFSKGGGHDYVDMIYLRREKEKHILPLVIYIYSMIFDKTLSKIEIDELCVYAEKISYICDNMYSEFCEYAFRQDFPDYTFIPHGSLDWCKEYTEINRLLQYPV